MKVHPVTVEDDFSDFQQSSTIQGRAVADAALVLLKAEGWKIIGIRQRPGGPNHPEIDIVAEDPDGLLWWIEIKGSYQNTPGLQRGDTVKKAIAVADDLMKLREEWSQDGETPIPYMVITSHLPKPDSLGYHMLRRAMERGAISAVRVLTLVEWTP